MVRHDLVEPALLDPVQQTVATLLQSYLNHPDVDRRQAWQLMQRLRAPMPGVHVRALKRAYQEFTRTRDLARLIASLEGLPLLEPDRDEARVMAPPLRREDLRLVCFDHVWS